MHESSIVNIGTDFQLLSWDRATFMCNSMRYQGRYDSHAFNSGWAARTSNDIGCSEIRKFVNSCRMSSFGKRKPSKHRP